jgi:hypothetical protein
MTITYFPAGSSSTNPTYVVPNYEFSTVSADWATQIARGKVAGTTLTNIFAVCPNQSTTQRTIWELGGTTEYVFPASALTMTVTSSSTGDVGTAQVLINGLDASYNPISETVTLNGTTGVTTVNQYFRINGAIMVRPASGQTANAGNISITNGGVTYGYISTGFGKSQGAYYTVPNGFTLYLYEIDSFSGSSSGSNYVSLDVKTTNNAVSNPVTLTLLQSTYQLTYAVTRVIPIPQTQKTDIRWRASVNTGTHSVTLLAIGFLMDNTAA